MPFERLSEHVYRFSDICNVYVIKSRDIALVIDFGTGAVLDHLNRLGIRQVEWVLHTHHHRDQAQGDGRLAKTGTKTAVPSHEAYLFEAVEHFWQTKNVYDLYDLTNVFNSLTHNVPVSLQLEDNARFVWENIAFTVQPTPGHTKGSVTYLAEIDGIAYAFCGDLIYAPGRVWSLYDLQWDYVKVDALNVGIHSVRVLRQKHVQCLAPSHGHAIAPAEAALVALENNMSRLMSLTINRAVANPQAALSSSVDNRIQRVTEHLIAVGQRCANFYILSAPDGSALAFDYGFPSEDHLRSAGARFVEHSLVELLSGFDIRTIDVMVPTHYHDDHVAGIPFLQRRFGTRVWAHESFADILEHPDRYRLPCLWEQPIAVDRYIGEGETIDWKGYRFEVYHSPGHTWYQSVLLGEIDGLRIAITGDEILRNRLGQLQGGGPVYRNRLYVDSFVRGIQRIIEFEPDYLLTGHSGAIPVTRTDLEIALRWATELEDCWRCLAAMPTEPNFSLDPDVVSIYPYQACGAAGEPINIRAEIRNHYDHEVDAVLRLLVPDGWQAEPAEQRLRLSAGVSGYASFTVTAPADAEPGARHLIAVDTELGELRLGQVAEGWVRLS
jgi:glyoxylase-like metal-dependent hydrolase (beta-lactamase superfamily II)